MRLASSASTRGRVMRGAWGMRSWVHGDVNLTRGATVNEETYVVRARESAGLAWLAEQGVRVPQFVVIPRGTDLDSVPVPFGPPFVVKPDVAVGGKGQRGLVQRCANVTELQQATARLFGETFDGSPLSAVVIEECVDGDEYFLSVTIDEAHRGPIIRCAPVGGVGFDATDTSVCEASLATGLDDEALYATIRAAGFPDASVAAVHHTLKQMWGAFVASEAVLVEVNPLKWDGETGTAVGIALEFDAHSRFAIDAHRPQLESTLAAELGRIPTVRETAVATADAREADRPGMTFFELDGDVAFVVAGGGAALFTFDYLHDHGLRPACYTDYSPGGGLDKLTALFEAALGIPNIRGVFVGVAVLNVMDTQFFADALLTALDTTGIDPRAVPIVARIAGPGEAVTLDRLRAVPGLTVFGREETLEHACGVLVRELTEVRQ